MLKRLYSSTKMMFLRVFCVVLYLHCGARSHPFDNYESIPQQQQTRLQSNDQRNVGVAQNLAYNQDYPSEVNYQRQHPIIQRPVKTINEPYSIQTEASRVQEYSPTHIIPETFVSRNEAPKRENILRQTVPIEYFHNPSLRKIDKVPHQPQRDIKESLRFYESPRLPINTKDGPPFKQEVLRLPLQSTSPGHIKTLTGQQPLEQKNQERRISYDQPNVEIKYSPQPDYNNYAMATFQNPTAEPVYKLKQAQPYEINPKLFLNKPQENTYINNALINSKRIQDIYKNEKPKKRYTIIHPDGRIEEFDQVDGIFDKNPNYVVVKFEDIIKQAKEGHQLVNNRQFPAQQNTKITVIKNREPSSAIRESNPENNTFKENNILLNTQDRNNNTHIELTGSYLPVSNETNVANTDYNATDLTSVNSKFLQEETSYTTTLPTPETITILNPSESNFELVNTSIVEKNETEEFQNNTNSLNTPDNEYEDVIVSDVLFNTSSTTVSPIIDNDFTDAFINTTEMPFATENIKSSVEQGISSDTNGNETSNLETTKINDTPTVYSTSIPNNENTTENSAFWFKADEQFWDKIINSTSTGNSIYFFFLAPKNTEKEIKTIEYPNGTIVEEVTETVTGEDGEPTVFKSTTVKNNSTNASSEK